MREPRRTPSPGPRRDASPRGGARRRARFCRGRRRPASRPRRGLFIPRAGRGDAARVACGSFSRPRSSVNGSRRRRGGAAWIVRVSGSRRRRGGAARIVRVRGSRRRRGGATWIVRVGTGRRGRDAAVRGNGGVASTPRSFALARTGRRCAAMLPHAASTASWRARSASTVAGWSGGAPPSVGSRRASSRSRAAPAVRAARAAARETKSSRGRESSPSATAAARSRNAARSAYHARSSSSTSPRAERQKTRTSTTRSWKQAVMIIAIRKPT